MNILSAENLSKQYMDKLLFQNIGFGINDNDKIGVIGVNGTGKSTLLKVIAGLIEPDRGRITRGSDIRIQYLSQHPEFNITNTVLEQVFAGTSPVLELVREYEEALHDLNNEPEDINKQQALAKLNPQMDALAAWDMESEAKTILTKLGIFNYSASIGQLSGGQKKRVALAAALIAPADLLILDEPTNHIDNDTIEWLEQYLKSRKGALLMVTHDRYFLDRVTNKIIELDNGQLFTYEGNYSVFVEKKVEREQEAIRTEQKKRNIFRQELAWMKRGARARSTKQKARTERFEQLKQTLMDNPNEKLEINVGVSRLGKKVIELNGVNKCYGDKYLIKDFAYIIQPTDRIGIVGPNGVGKTTLLNIITQKVLPDTGFLDIGITVKIGYYAQENLDINEDLRAIEYIRETAEVINTADGSTISAAQLMENFLFPANLQYTPIGKLSGGEKRRLHLLKVLMGAPNVLLLDEPTNDLDIQTLTILEEYLEAFQGAVIVVSHDRYFLDKVTHKILAFKDNGIITEYNGIYSEYFAEAQVKHGGITTNANKSLDKIVYPSTKKPKALKFTFKEQQEYQEIDEKIAQAESDLALLTEKINKAGSDFGLLNELAREQQCLERLLEGLLERWVYLNELAEEIEQQKAQR